MGKIVLKSGDIVLIDDTDQRLVDGVGGWFKDKDGYAIADKIIKGRRKIIKMHRLIMNTPFGMETDHKNGNRLDNRRNNLRVCTHSENQRNRPNPNRNNKSGYKGVYWHEDRWIARIWFNSESIYLGRHTNKIKAARAYNEAALKYHGDFARLNAIKGG